MRTQSRAVETVLVWKRWRSRGVVLVGGQVEDSLHTFQGTLPGGPVPHVALDELYIAQRNVIGNAPVGVNRGQQPI